MFKKKSTSGSSSKRSSAPAPTLPPPFEYDEQGGDESESMLDAVDIPDIVEPETNIVPMIDDVTEFKRRIVADTDALKYIRSLRVKAFPRNDVRVYLYEGCVEAKKYPKHSVIFDLETGDQIAASGKHLPPISCTYRTNMHVLRDTKICMCHAVPIKKRDDDDYILVFANVGADPTPLYIVLDYYECISNPDETFEGEYIMGNADNPVLLNAAIKVGETMDAVTFVDWANTTIKRWKRSD